MRLEHSFPTTGNPTVLYRDNASGYYYRWTVDGYSRVAPEDLERLGLSSKVVCFYHKNCYDGSAAAAAVLKAHPEATLIPVNYGDPIDLEDLVDARVYVVDFSFPEETILQLIERVQRLVILDHHRSFRDTAQRLQLMNDSGSFGANLLEIVYDESRSGALITWQYFFPDSPVPELVKHISDRDLWSFQMLYTRQITMALGMRSNDPASYLEMIEKEDSIYEQLKIEGTVLTQKLERDIENIINTTLRFVVVEGRKIPLVNCAHTMASETLARLCQEHGVAVSYYDGAEGRVYSIRSGVTDPEEAERIAKKFGGGGHPRAAGWRTSYIAHFDEGNLASAEVSKILDDLQNENDSVYEERTYVVAALSRAFPSGIRATSIPGWNPAWESCVYIDLPSGQISYHYHNRHRSLFQDLPPYQKPFDGHNKAIVHQRLSALGLGPYRRYLEEFIQEHRVIALSNNPDLRPEEIANLSMWCEKLEKFIMAVQMSYETGIHPKKFWN